MRTRTEIKRAFLCIIAMATVLAANATARAQQAKLERKYVDCERGQISADGKTIAAGVFTPHRSGRVTLYSAVGGADPIPVTKRLGVTEASLNLKFARFLKDGTLVVGGIRVSNWDPIPARLTVWRIKGKSIEKIDLGPVSKGDSFVCSSDGTTIARCAAREMVVYSLATKLKVYTASIRPRYYGLSPSGQMLACQPMSGPIQVWKDGKKIQEIPLESKFPAATLVFSPDEKLLACGQSNDVRLWDLAKKKLATSIKMRGQVQLLAFSPDGRLIASSGATKVSRGSRDVWQGFFLVETATGRKIVDHPQAHRKKLQSLSFSPDGRTVLTCGNAKLKLWDVKALARVQK